MLVSLLLLAACTPAPPPLETFTGRTMGTDYTVKVVAETPLTAEEHAELSSALHESMDEVNARMSTYLQESELSRFNTQETREPFALSEQVLAVMAIAQRLSTESGGAFDMTIGPLVNAWGFGPDGLPPEPPAQEELDALKQRVGFDKVELLEGAARKREPGILCDLSAVAKGYAVDRAAELLIERGYDRFLVELGGEVRASGTNLQDQPWRIGIERPQTEGRGVQKVVPLHNLAMATSGDYRNYYEMDGRRYSHTIDPRTGRPVEHGGASVSVVIETCAEADGLATVLLVLGPEEGYAFAEERDLAVLFLNYDGEGGVTERATPAFEALLTDAVQ